jgi:hypothetical protein
MTTAAVSSDASDLAALQALGAQLINRTQPLIRYELSVVVPHPAAPRHTAARVRAAVVTALEPAGALPPPVEVVRVEAIEREAGHAAKLKLVKSVAPGR